MFLSWTSETWNLAVWTSGIIPLIATEAYVDAPIPVGLESLLTFYNLVIGQVLLQRTVEPNDDLSLGRTERGENPTPDFTGARPILN